MAAPGASSASISNPLVSPDAIPSTSTAGVINRPDGPVYDDDEDLLASAVSRVRLVQFQKDTEEPMGITLKVFIFFNSWFDKEKLKK